MRITRRGFLKIAGGSVAAAAASMLTSQLSFLQTIPEIANPLAFYPSRDWEKAYRDLYRVDSQFTFLCAPNDTHNCLLKASVKSGVVTRIEPSYQYGNATDLYGNQASHSWDPRGRLRNQAYDPAMIEKQHGYGTQVLKFRGGMPFLGATRVFGLHRMANSLA